MLIFALNFTKLKMADKNFHGSTEGIGYIYVGLALVVIFSIVFCG